MPDQDEQPLRHFRSPSAQELCVWWAAQHEVDFALAAVRRVRATLAEPPETVDVILVTAYLEAAILRATRVFEGRHPVPQTVFTELPDGAKEFYRYLLNVRNKHIAHRANPVEEVKAGVVLRPEREQSGPLVQGAGAFGMQLQFWDPANLKSLSEFLEALGVVCARNFNRCSDALRLEASALPESALRALPPVRLVVKKRSHLTSGVSEGQGVDH